MRGETALHSQVNLVSKAMKTLLLFLSFIKFPTVMGPEDTLRIVNTLQFSDRVPPHLVHMGTISSIARMAHCGMP